MLISRINRIGVLRGLEWVPFADFRGCLVTRPKILEILIFSFSVKDMLVVQKWILYYNGNLNLVEPNCLHFTSEETISIPSTVANARGYENHAAEDYNNFANIFARVISYCHGNKRL